MEKFQTKVLRAVISAPWFVSNKDIYSEVDLLPVSETIAQFSEI